MPTATQLKQFKEMKTVEKQSKQAAYIRAVETMEEAFFRKNVPVWKRWLMQRSSFLRKFWLYEIARGEDDPMKLVLLKAKTKWGKVIMNANGPAMEVVARTF